MLSLPAEVLQHVALQLPVSDIIQLCNTHMYLHQAISVDETFWPLIWHRDFSVLPLNIDYKENILRILSKAPGVCDASKRDENLIQVVIEEGLDMVDVDSTDIRITRQALLEASFSPYINPVVYCKYMPQLFSFYNFLPEIGTAYCSRVLNATAIGYYTQIRHTLRHPHALSSADARVLRDCALLVDDVELYQRYLVAPNNISNSARPHYDVVAMGVKGAINIFNKYGIHAPYARLSAIMAGHAEMVARAPAIVVTESNLVDLMRHLSNHIFNVIIQGNMTSLVVHLAQILQPWVDMLFSEDVVMCISFDSYVEIVTKLYPYLTVSPEVIHRFVNTDIWLDDTINCCSNNTAMLSLLYLIDAPVTVADTITYGEADNSANCTLLTASKVYRQHKDGKPRCVGTLRDVGKHDGYSLNSTAGAWRSLTNVTHRLCICSGNTFKVRIDDTVHRTRWHYVEVGAELLIKARYGDNVSVYLV